MSSLDPREYGLAPRLYEAGSDGAQVYTMAGVMTASGIKSRTTFYNTPWLMALRRNHGTDAMPRWRWNKKEVDAAIAARPKAAPSLRGVIAKTLVAQTRGGGSAVRARKAKSKALDATMRAQAQTQPERSLTDYLNDVGA